MLVKTNLKTKISLIIFGFFLFFALLEIGLRLAGVVFLSIQEYRNRQALRQKGAYRIMCLGESTTFEQYPPFLQEALNRSNIGIKFSVIDKGVPATLTPVILAKLESNLNEYHPDMVITMMGINDWWGRLGPYDSKTVVFLKSLRTYKLIKILWSRILFKLKEAGFFNLRYSQGNYSKRIQDHSAIIESKKINNGVIIPEGSVKKSAKLNSENYLEYFNLGWSYRDKNKFTESEYAFKKSIELNSRNDDAYFQLGWLYWRIGKFSQAEETFRKAIELNPKNDRAYGALSVICKKIGKTKAAEEYHKKAEILRLEYYSPVPVKNYLKLKEILDKRKIRLICVQYPMRSVEPLKKIFENSDKGEDIIFVDNEKIFRDAVSREGFEEYFKDIFGGDFGHCTDKGNKLLADNIANVILKYVFGRGFR